jgi:two-component system OmpR family sensor kinase
VSIRWRLTLWNVALLALSLVTFAVLAYVTLARSLYDELDQSLEARVHQVVESAQPGFFLNTIDFPHVSEIASPGVYIQVINPAGQVARQSDNLQGVQLPVDPSVLALNLTGHTQLVTTKIEGVPIRILNAPIVFNNHVIGVIQVARSMSTIEATLGRLRLILTLGVIGMLLIGSVGGTLLIRAGLHPIDEIIQVAQRIGRAEDLSQRLDYQGPPDEVGQLAATFNEMLGRLERAFQAQRRFVADASHALRTPITTIRGNVELLLQQRNDPVAQEASLKAIQRETQRTAHLVSELLLLAQADAGQTLEHQPVEMATLLLDVYQQARVMTDGVGVALGHEDQGLVMGDPDRLKEVLLNLVDNALNYTPGGGKVTLSLYHNEPWVLVSVADTGPGIPADDLPHIFERFYRAKGIKSRPGRPSGTGLGLSIARWIVEQHGGHITVESQVGKGSTFSVWLPAAPEM